MISFTLIGTMKDGAVVIHGTSEGTKVDWHSTIGSDLQLSPEQGEDMSKAVVQGVIKCLISYMGKKERTEVRYLKGGAEG